MQTMQHEQTGLPETSYAENTAESLDNTEELERRLNALRKTNTGPLDTAEIERETQILIKEYEKKKSKESKIDQS